MSSSDGDVGLNRLETTGLRDPEGAITDHCGILVTEASCVRLHRNHDSLILHLPPPPRLPPSLLPRMCAVTVSFTEENICMNGAEENVIHRKRDVGFRQSKAKMSNIS